MQPGSEKLFHGAKNSARGDLGVSFYLNSLQPNRAITSHDLNLPVGPTQDLTRQTGRDVAACRSA